MPLDFEQMTPAGTWSDPCVVAIMDLRRNCHDEFVAAYPRFLGRYLDGQSVDLLLTTGYSRTPSTDICVPSTLSGGSMKCTYQIPDQEFLSYGGDQNKLLRDLVDTFCKARNLVMAPTLFNSDGSFNSGEPLAGYFLQYMLSEQKGAFMSALIDIFWDGDSANPHEFDGFLTQLDEDVECGPYNPTRLDWATLTEVVGVSNVSSEITAANDTITIKGESFSGMTGVNFAQFLKMWVERLFKGPFSTYNKSEVELRLVVGPNTESTLLELAACLQPCQGCVNPLSDPTIRDRVEDFVNGKEFFLYPWRDIKIKIYTSPKIGNRIILMPFYIGGNPMTGWIFRSQQEQQAIISGLLPMYGTTTGTIQGTDLYPDELNDLSSADNFEWEAIAINVEKSGDCVSWWLTADASLVIFGRDNILSVTNISGTGLVSTCDPTPMVMPFIAESCDDEALPEAYELQATVTEEDGLGNITVGATYNVLFADGTVLIATVTNYSLDINVYIIDLSFDESLTMTCASFGGLVSMAPR